MHWAELSRNLQVGPARPLADVHVLVVWGGVAMAGLIATFGLGDSGARKALPVLLCGLALTDGFFTGRLMRPFYSHQDPAVLSEWRTLLEKHSPDLDGPGSAPQVSNGSLSFTTLLTKTPVPLLTGFNTLKNHLCAAWVATPELLQVILRERALFSPTAVEVPVSDTAFDAFVRRTKVLGRPPLLIHSRDGLQSQSGGRAALAPEMTEAVLHAPAVDPLPVESSATVRRPSPCASNAPRRDGCYLDRWAAGWQATVNGRTQPILAGMFLYRALRVPAGASEIQFWYRPYGYPSLLILSWSTIAIVLASSTVSFVLRRRRSKARHCAGTH